jgi:response regulator of citrate/malate metabolism
MMMLDLKNFYLITPGIHLSDSSGISLLKEVRGNQNETKKEITFLIISSEERKVDFEELKKISAVVYIVKRMCSKVRIFKRHIWFIVLW